QLPPVGDRGVTEFGVASAGGPFGGLVEVAEIAVRIGDVDRRREIGRQLTGENQHEALLLGGTHACGSLRARGPLRAWVDFVNLVNEMPAAAVDAPDAVSVANGLRPVLLRLS